MSGGTLRGMKKQHCVYLSDDQRRTLEGLVSAGTAAARKLAHARILLKADQGPAGPAWTDGRIAEALEVSLATVERVRRRYAAEGLAAAVSHRPPARHRPRRLDGAQEAHLVALVCGDPPAGRERWTLRLLADRLVELEITASVSYQTVRRTLKKMHCSPGARSAGASRPVATATSLPRWKTRSASTSGPTIPATR
jgi:transposase